MAAQSIEFEKEFGIEGHPAFCLGVELNHPTTDSVGIELLVPRSVQGIGKIDASSIAADFDHLRTTIQG